MCGLFRRLFYPLFIEEKRSFFFSLFRLLYFFSCLFVCLCIRCWGGVILVACIVIPYSRTDAIHFKRFIKRDFLLRSNRLIDYFLSLFSFSSSSSFHCCSCGERSVHLSFLERGDQGDKFSLFFFLLHYFE